MAVINNLRPGENERTWWFIIFCWYYLPLNSAKNLTVCNLIFAGRVIREASNEKTGG
jgi:hypothetical protein